MGVMGLLNMYPLHYVVMDLCELIRNDTFSFLHPKGSTNCGFLVTGLSQPCLRMFTDDCFIKDGPEFTGA